MEVRRGRTSDQVTKAMKDTSKPRLNSYYGGAESCFVNSAGLEIERESALKGIFLLTRGSLLMEGCPGPPKTMVYPTGIFEAKSVTQGRVADVRDNRTIRDECHNRSEEHTSELQSLRHLV